MDYNSVYIQQYKFIYKQQTWFMYKNITFFTNIKQIIYILRQNINRNIFSESVHSLGMFRTDLQVFAIERYLDLFS